MFSGWHFAHSDRNRPVGFVTVVHGSVTSQHRGGPAIVTSHNGRYLVLSSSSIIGRQSHCYYMVRVTLLSDGCGTAAAAAWLVDVGDAEERAAELRHATMNDSVRHTTKRTTIRRRLSDRQASLRNPSIQSQVDHAAKLMCHALHGGPKK